MEDGGELDNPLLKTLPPATDYLNYLIVIEHNLTKDRLPTLHNVLQDTKLTANIGWDLVRLLLPLLPDSEQCLQDVARLGNPREVVLKVTELLGEIKNEAEEEDAEDQVDEVADDSGNVGATGERAEQVNNTSDQEAEKPDTQQSLVIQYSHLVRMLGILHPRIKTKYPSRFLSTSLQAVLPAYARLARHSLATEATLDLIKALSPAQRPKLPPRKSSSQIPTTSSAVLSAPDPEAQAEVAGTDEVALQNRLIQSFLTFVAEGYVSSFKAYEDIPGLAWSCRFYEKSNPEKQIQGKPSYIKIFVAEEEELHLRDTILGQCLAFSRDLKIHPIELLSNISHEDPPENEDDEALPSKASDVPLSKTGSLYLFCALAASSTLFDAPVTLPPLSLFPTFAGILTNSLSASGSSTLGGEQEATIDAILFLGHMILTQSSSTDVSSDSLFHDTLQKLSLLSANTPSAPLRYQAHLLASSILHLHPSPNNRLAFITDTLEHCPYDNLRASAVGWLKDEILAAQAESTSPKIPAPSDKDSIFTTPAVLIATAPLLLIDAPSMIHQSQDRSTSSSGAQQADTYAIFEQHMPFILAVLNLLYLLISSPGLCEGLQIKSLGKEFDIIDYCDRIRAASLLFQGWLNTQAKEIGDKGLDEQRQSDENEKQLHLSDLQLLDHNIDKVMGAAGKAGLS